MALRILMGNKDIGSCCIIIQNHPFMFSFRIMHTHTYTYEGYVYIHSYVDYSHFVALAHNVPYAQYNTPGVSLVAITTTTCTCPLLRTHSASRPTCLSEQSWRSRSYGPASLAWKIMSSLHYARNTHKVTIPVEGKEEEQRFNTTKLEILKNDSRNSWRKG